MRPLGASTNVCSRFAPFLSAFYRLDFRSLSLCHNGRRTDSRISHHVRPRTREPRGLLRRPVRKPERPLRLWKWWTMPLLLPRANWKPMYVSFERRSRLCNNTSPSPFRGPSRLRLDLPLGAPRSRPRGAPRGRPLPTLRVGPSRRVTPVPLRKGVGAPATTVTASCSPRTHWPV